MSLLQLAGLQQSAAGGSAPVADLLWLDAQTGISITSGSPDRINTWTDQSVNGHVMLTPGGAESPIVDSGTTVLNGYAIPTSTGNDNCYLNEKIGLADAVAAGGASVYVVVGNLSGHEGDAILGEGSSTDNDPLCALRWRPTGGEISAAWRNDAGTYNVNAPDTGLNEPTTGFAVVSAVWTDGQFEWWSNGSHPVDANNPYSYTLSGTFTMDRFAIGGVMRSSLIWVHAWELAEVRVYGEAHDDTTRGLVETEMTDRWSL